MADQQYAEQIARYLSGNLPKAETAALMQWMDSNADNRNYFKEMQALWELSQHEEQFHPDVQLAWKKVAQRLDPPKAEPEKARTVSIFRYINRVAAIILLLVFAGYGLWQLWLADVPSELVYQTEAGQQEEFVLPDGSKVWLNESSKITYQPPFDERILQLEGEAFFEVEKKDGKPFEIRAGNSKTVVLGTRFNVRAYNGDPKVEVTVKSGRVAISAIDETAEAVILEAGESGRVDKTNHLASRKTETVVNADAWKTQKLIFDDVPLSEVIPVLERYFHLNIKVGDHSLLKCHIKGTYEQPDFAQIKEVLGFILNIEIEQKGNTYILKGKGCNE